MANTKLKSDYDRYTNNITKEIKKIQEYLPKHEKDLMAGGCKNYGYVGDLAYIYEMLIDITTTFKRR